MHIIKYGPDSWSINSKEDLTQVPTPALVREYNRLTGKEVKKFSSRDAGVSQVWNQIQVRNPKLAEKPEEAPAPVVEEKPEGTESTEKESDVASKKTTTKKTTSKRGKFSGDQKIKLKTEGCPFREGSDVFDRWKKAAPRDGTKVSTLLEKGLRRGDVRWLLHKGHVALED